MKIVVFDLDETLGYFTQFGIFWDCLKHCLNSVMTQTEFDEVLDLYPEFLRPNVLNILSFLKTKKRTNDCHKIMLYTNNTGVREWARQIVSYFEKKVHDPKLFDQIIGAFRVNGKRVEMCRTTYNKTLGDLVRCTKIPVDAEICFVDDSFHPAMAHENIYYINIKPYQYSLPFSEMMDRFKGSAIGHRLIEDYENFDMCMLQFIQPFNYRVRGKNPREYEVDKVIGKSIVGHLRTFFHGDNRAKTVKNRGQRRNRTFRYR
jgi:hypothetical protein